MTRLQVFFALAAAAALVAAPAAHATVGVHEVAVSIPATQPDDEGNPVALDGGVEIPDSGCPCPGVIINHGFLGRWQDSGNMAVQLASQGYVVLRYSSRGFGNTPGEVDLMGPKERQDLLDAVHWLNNPHNGVTDGVVTPNDIGQFGGSYGGAHAWSLAWSGDPAVRTVVPTATWSDAYDALLPNNVELLAYLNGFYATGFAPTGAPVNSSGQEFSTQNNYATEMHKWVAEANSGVGLDDLKAAIDTRSVKTHYDEVHIPVFIIQGTNDGLFSQNQAVDAYLALRHRHIPARLYVGGIGHPPSDSSLDHPEALHIGAEVLAWFDHYLKGVDNGIDEMPPIEYARADYFHNHWDGTTRSAWKYPFGKPKTFALCTTDPTGGTLSTTECPGALPAVAVNSYAGAGWDQEPVTASGANDVKNGLSQALGQPFPDLNDKPPVLVYDSAPLAKPLDMAGIPRLSLQVVAADSLPAGSAPRGTAAAFQLDPKFYDVAPDGTTKLLTRGAFAEPLDGAPLAAGPHEVAFDAFGLSNLVPAGDRLRLTLQTADAPYLRPTSNPFAVAVLAGSEVAMPTASKMVATPALGSATPVAEGTSTR